tara:strand:+ start:2982 stop:3185 length:204 start_codon:yes stop_codon:yes gene_type:complete
MSFRDGSRAVPGEQLFGSRASSRAVPFSSEQLFGFLAWQVRKKDPDPKSKRGKTGQGVGVLEEISHI